MSGNFVVVRKGFTRDLGEALDSDAGTDLNTIMVILRDLFQGTVLLHDAKIVHGNLSADAVVREAGDYKVLSFSSSVSVGDEPLDTFSTGESWHTNTCGACVHAWVQR